MTNAGVCEFRQLLDPSQITAELSRELVSCWTAVSNAGGAVGFPFLPVTEADVAPAAERLIAELSPERCRLLLAVVDSRLAGWLKLSRNPSPLISHWGSIQRVQTRTDLRGRGIGAALLGYARQVARDELGLEQLRLSVRGGLGLEVFYSRLGWVEIGRWPGALRLAPGDDRDDILMLLSPL